MKKSALFAFLLCTHIVPSGFAEEASPEKMMYDLHEEATCMAAADYLNNPRRDVHRRNYSELTSEYEVPAELAKDITELADAQYSHFIERATKRYDKEILPTMLLSAYTHRCEFMNGFEARRQFDSAPPEI